ncbi:MAG: hypothetical protein GKC53_05950 [Neisseriaceae bacterium]|nr:MAG: hypothetical protein GKC53_05950 [Neisseriaceae bacterium]
MGIKINKRGFPNDKNLDKTEDRIIKQVEANPAKYLADYDELPDLKDYNGRYVNSDQFKELFSEFTQSKASRAYYNNAVHNSAACLSSLKYDEVLAKDDGNKNKVVIVTGIPGAGKTKSIDEEIDKKNVKLIFEGQLSNPENGGFDKIQKALDKGYKVKIVVAHRPPEQALDNIYHRIRTYGRGASIAAMANIQGNLPDGLNKINKRFPNQTQLVIKKLDGWDMSTQIKGWDKLEQLKEFGNSKEIRDKLSDKLVKDYLDGKIDDKIFLSIAPGGKHFYMLKDVGKWDKKGCYTINPEFRELASVESLNSSSNEMKVALSDSFQVNKAEKEYQNLYNKLSNLEKNNFLGYEKEVKDLTKDLSPNLKTKALLNFYTEQRKQIESKDNTIVMERSPQTGMER